MMEDFVMKLYSLTQKKYWLQMELRNDGRLCNEALQTQYWTYGNYIMMEDFVMNAGQIRLTKSMQFYII